MTNRTGGTTVRRALLCFLAALVLLTPLPVDAGAGGVHRLEWVLEESTLIFDAEVTSATRAPDTSAIDFAIRDAHVLRGVAPAGISQVRFAPVKLREPGKVPPRVDPGSAEEAYEAKSGRWIFFARVDREGATAIHVRPIGDLAMVQAKLGGTADPDAGPSGIAPAADAGASWAAPDAGRTSYVAPSQPRPTKAGCGCSVRGGGGSFAVVGALGLALAAVVRRRRRASPRA